MEDTADQCPALDLKRLMDGMPFKFVVCEMVYLKYSVALLTEQKSPTNYLLQNLKHDTFKSNGLTLPQSNV